MFRHIYVSDIAGPTAATGAFVLGIRWPCRPAYSQGEGGSVTAQAVTDGALCTPVMGGGNAGVEDAGNGAVARRVTSAMGWGVVTMRRHRLLGSAEIVVHEWPILIWHGPWQSLNGPFGRLAQHRGRNEARVRNR